MLKSCQQKMRVIGIVAATTGLRISEVTGLKCDGHRLEDVADGRYSGRSWTALWEVQNRDLPQARSPSMKLTTAEAVAGLEAVKLATQSRRTGSSPAERVQGKMPPWADTRFWIVSCNSCRKTGRNHKSAVGFHTFRHTYSTLLKAERGRCQSGSGIR